MSPKYQTVIHISCSHVISKCTFRHSTLLEMGLLTLHSCAGGMIGRQYSGIIYCIVKNGKKRARDCSLHTSRPCNVRAANCSTNPCCDAKDISHPFSHSQQHRHRVKFNAPPNTVQDGTQQQTVRSRPQQHQLRSPAEHAFVSSVFSALKCAIMHYIS